MNSNNYFVEPTAYAGWILDESIRYRSSSGGIFSALAAEVLNRGGVVYGATYVDDLTVHHVRIDSIDSLSKLQGSKYVQSHIGETYGEVVKDLKAGKKVLFSGTPCQTAAVNAIVDEQFRENLLTVDVLCHGVPSEKAWKTYLNEVANDDESRVIDCNMRDKSNGWHRFRVRLKLENGSDHLESFHEGVWGPAFYTNLFLRESCYKCRFKNKVRDADITLGDFWGAAREDSLRKYDDNNKGTSVILANSEKGKNVINSLEGCHIEEIEYDCLLKGLYVLYKSSDRNFFREWAFESLSKFPFKEIVERTVHPSFINKVRRKVWMYTSK